MTTTATDIRTRARRSYELARLRHALAWSMPIALLFAIVAIALHAIVLPAVFTVLLFFASVLFLWLGQLPARSVLPGVVFGLLPYGAGMLAKSIGHVCTGLFCLDVCLPLCLGSGFIASLFVARFIARGPKTSFAMFFFVAATALLTGAISGSCVGFHGVLGMSLGLLLCLPWVWWRKSSHKE